MARSSAARCFTPDSPSDHDRGAKTLLDSEHLRDLVWLRVDDDSVGKGMKELLEVRNPLRYQAPPPKYPANVVESIPANKISAIKNYCESSGAGLADSKMAVDRIVDELGFGACPGNERAVKLLRGTTRWCGARDQN